jgi:hypothetical protein
MVHQVARERPNDQRFKSVAKNFLKKFGRNFYGGPIDDSRRIRLPLLQLAIAAAHDS